MSHFCVLVATKTDDEDELRAALQPYHEFESTGMDDQYVVDVDETDELKSQWETGTALRYCDATGGLHEPYADQFYRDPLPEERDKIGMGTGVGNGLSWTSKDWGDGQGYRTKVHFVPDGWSEVEVPRRNVTTLREFLSDYTDRPEVLPGGRETYGWTEVTDLGADGQVIRCIHRTNPQKKWDYWSIGGRYSNRLALATGGMVDQAVKRDVDMDGQIAKRTREAEVEWDLAQEIMGGQPFRPWADIRKEMEPDIHAARTAYWAQPALKALDANDAFRWSDKDELLLPRAEYAKATGMCAATTFAILHNGEWFERGSMGWWGVVSNKSDSWSDTWMIVYKTIPDDYTLTIVDCHI